jgi:hypothetical protein
VIQVDGSLGDSAQAVFTVTAGPFIQLSPSSGATGIHIKIKGGGFLPGDNPCSLSSPTDSDVVVNGACSFFTVKSGPFKGFQNVTGGFVVGNVPPGSYVIQVDGSLGDSAQAVFTVTAGPSLKLLPSSGGVGIQVKIKGGGFLPGDNPCSLSSPTDSNVVLNGACNFFTVTSGKFNGFQNVTGSFVVGSVPPGSYVIQVDGSLGDSAQAIFTVPSQFQPSISLKPASCSASSCAGTVVSVSGSGFNPADYCDSGSFSSSSPGLISDASCSMTNGKIIAASFTVAGGLKAGKYTVVLIASTLDSAEVTFTVK